MFNKQSILSAALLALSSGVFAKPINMRRHFGSSDIQPLVVLDGQSFDVESVSVKEFSVTHSFDSFGGLHSLSGFDHFFGVDNFCGVQNVQVFEQEEVVTCQVVDINVIQQQFSILAEYAKRLVLTQSCDVETQVIAFSQWVGGLVAFNEDLRRVSTRKVSFDSVIASHISKVVDVSGNINTADFGFLGSDIGSHSVTIVGGNWNDQTSPESVGLSWQSSITAAGPIPLGSTSSSVVSVPPVSSIPACPPGLDCTLPPVSVSSGSSISSLPPVVVSSGDSVSSLPPTTIDACPPGLDCSLPSVSSGSSISSIPPPDVSSGSSIPPSADGPLAPPTDGTVSIAGVDTASADATPTDVSVADASATDASAPADPAATDASSVTDAAAPSATDASVDTTSADTASPTIETLVAASSAPASDVTAAARRRMAFGARRL